jgi:hypothetical protein
MKRMRVLLGQRRVMVLATLAILVLAAAALAASSASFTATSANPGNTFTAGNLQPSGPAGAILTAGPMAPGDITTGSATIGNTGNVSGVFYLSGVMDTRAATYSAGFAHDLHVSVTVDGAPVVALTDVALDTALTTPVALGTWAGGQSRTVGFAVEFIDNGVNAAGVGNDNAFMNATATIDLTWTAISN